MIDLIRNVVIAVKRKNIFNRTNDKKIERSLNGKNISTGPEKCSHCTDGIRYEGCECGGIGAEIGCWCGGDPNAVMEVTCDYCDGKGYRYK